VVVYPDSDLIWVSTTDGADDVIVRRGGGLPSIAPWTGDVDSE
jgi:D-hexose-6-phosphate mutarotase